MASICRGLNELKNTVLRNQPHFPVVNELKIYLPFKWAHHILDKNTQTLVLFNLDLTICVCVCEKLKDMNDGVSIKTECVF